MAALLVAACGSGTGRPGSAVFEFSLAGTVPSDGATDVATTSSIAVTFSSGADPATVDETTVQLFRSDGTRLAAEIRTQGFNPSNLQIVPLAPLEAGQLYRVVLSRLIQGTAGGTLGFDREVCFVTASPTPTVRPDQLIDLGNRLIVARYLAQVVRLQGGTFLVFGGYVDRDTVTDAVEQWDPATQSFQLLPFRMTTSRAEHTATLMTDGRVLIAGGVAAVGGAPLGTTEIYDPASQQFVPGPPLNTPRRHHGASVFLAGVLVSGGFEANGDELDTIEVLVGNQFQIQGNRMGAPTARHLQVSIDFGTVYMSASNLQRTSTVFRDTGVPPTSAAVEPDIRFRPAGVIVDGTRVLQVGGDTRSIAIFDLALGNASLATDLLTDRRGAHTLTPRGDDGARFLAAGGFQISNGGLALRSLEIIDYFPGAQPDAVTHLVELQLPVPFAGHVAFRDTTGVTVLAGGFGGVDEDDDPAVHSRRVVLILDAASTPTIACGN